MSDISELFKGGVQSSSEQPLDPNFVVTHDEVDAIARERLDRDSKVFHDIVHRPTTVVRPSDNANVEYEPSADLFGDVFHSLMTEEPDVRSGAEVRTDRQLNRKIMEEFLQHPDARKANIMCSGDALMSAIVTGKMREEVEPILHDLLKSDNQQPPEQGDGTGQDPNGTPQPGQNAISAGPDPSAVDEGLLASLMQKAAEEASDEADSVGNLPGYGTGEYSQQSIDDVMALAKQWRNSAKLRDVLQMVGRMERAFRFHATKRTIGGSEEPIDFELGNDLARVLPSEMVRLRHPVMRKEFVRRYLEHSLMQNEMLGHADAGMGPLVVLRDVSGSMSGDREIWATAVCLATLANARRDRRDVAFIDFDSCAKIPVVIEAAKRLDLRRITKWAESASTGAGTSLAAAVRAGMNLIQDGNRAFRRADVLMVTDGLSQWNDTSHTYCLEALNQGIRVHGVGIQTHLKSHDRLVEAYMNGGYDRSVAIKHAQKAIDGDFMHNATRITHGALAHIEDLVNAADPALADAVAAALR